MVLSVLIFFYEDRQLRKKSIWSHDVIIMQHNKTCSSIVEQLKSNRKGVVG